MIIDMVEFGFALWWVKDFPISAEVIVIVVRICLQCAILKLMRAADPKAERDMHN